MSYQAVAARIHTRPLPGADKLQIGACLGYQVVVGLDVEDGALGIFFSAEDGQLSEGFAAANDLVRRKDDAGNPAGGFFEPNRRVRAIKLRGARSEGFWCPLKMFEYTGAKLDRLTEGETFTELNGHAICNKYVTPQTARAAAANQARQRKANAMFAKHIETEQFKRAGMLIPEGAACYVSAKLHGTSHRVGHVLEEVPVRGGWLGRRVSRLLGWPETRREWVVLNGTRNTVIEQRNGPGFYGQEGFRTAATMGLALHKGEIVYGELVGYTETGGPIMEPQATTNLHDKQLVTLFGKTMVYRYGQAEGQCAFFVYRITQVNEDGRAVELSWPQVAGRCRELGLRTVPLIETFIYDGDLEALTRRLTAYVNGEQDDGFVPSRVDPSHIEEGVVLRYESEHGFGWQKLKGFYFGVLEGYLKENPEVVDREEAV